MRMQLGDAIKGGMQYSSSERLFAKSLRCSLFAFINHHVLGQGYVLHHRERRALTCAQGRAPPGGEGKGLATAPRSKHSPTSWEEERYEATASEVGGGRGGGGSKRTSVSAQPPPHRPHPVRIPQIRVSAVVLRVSGPGRRLTEPAPAAWQRC